MKVHQAFAIPVIQFKFTKHDEYEFPHIKKIIRSPKDWPIPINTSYPNIQDDDPIVPPDLRERLKADLMVDIKNVLKELNIHNEFEMRHLWYNVMHDHQGVHPHHHLSDCRHRSPFWCGIYYNKNATPTQFHRHDDIICRTQEFPGWLDSTIADCFKPKFIPDVEDGDIVLFPPHLTHSAFQKSLKMRITFAWNIHLVD